MKSVIIKITEKNQSALRDTTIGKPYNAIRLEVGDVEPQTGCTVYGAGYIFFDDAGEYAVKKHDTGGKVQEV